MEVGDHVTAVIIVLIWPQVLMAPLVVPQGKRFRWAGCRLKSLFSLVVVSLMKRFSLFQIVGHFAQIDSAGRSARRWGREIEAERPGHVAFIGHKGGAGHHGHFVLLNSFGTEFHHVDALGQGAPDEEAAFGNSVCHDGIEMSVHVEHQLRLLPVDFREVCDVGVPIVFPHELLAYHLGPDIGVNVVCLFDDDDLLDDLGVCDQKNATRMPGDRVFEKLPQ